MPKPRHFDAVPLEDLVSFHNYGKDNKINCGLCYRRKERFIKIKYRNFPYQGPCRNYVMTICTDCRDNMMRVMTVEKLMGRV
jgi:hypothetical protein